MYIIIIYVHTSCLSNYKSSENLTISIIHFKIRTPLKVYSYAAFVQILLDSLYVLFKLYRKIQ